MRKNNKDYIIITLAGFLLKIKIVKRSYFGGRQDVILVCAKAHIIHPIIMTLKKKTKPDSHGHLEITKNNRE